MRFSPSGANEALMIGKAFMALASALVQVRDLFNNGQYALLAIDVAIIVCAIFVMLEASSALLRERRQAAAATPE